MRALACACVAILMAATAERAAAQEKMNVTELISAVAAKTGKKFIVEPRVQGEITLFGQEPASVTIADLATILQVYGFTLFEGGGYVRVVPDAWARVMPTPIVSGNEKRADGEFVTRIIKVKSMPATQLVPLLRPIIPQNGHLAAVPCTNVLMVVDTFANARRLESVVQSLDTGGEPYQPGKCTAPREAAPPAPVNPARN
jgi:type II secretory pathway component GspD/PulD (secretin)